MFRRQPFAVRAPGAPAPGIAFVVLLVLAGCGHAPEPPRDVVLVTIDTLRYDALGRGATPVLDGLAKDGVAFSDAHAHAVVTLVSHASILTGLYPYQHGVHDNSGFSLSPAHETLAARLAAHGFATGAFVSAYVLDHRYGLARGFQTYDDALPGRSARDLMIAERPGDETVRRATRWWHDHRDARRFLWVHLFAPHYPYEPPEPYRSRFPREPYLGEVAAADAQLGALLADVREGGAAPLVIVTSDHGESLGEHGEPTHGLFAYEATLHVPLVVAGPGVSARPHGVRGARHIDIVPTVLDLLRLPAAGGLPGASLFRTEQVARASYFEALSAYFNRGWAPLTGRIEAGTKAIRLPLPELYDVDHDPGERENLVERRPDAFARIVSANPAEPWRAGDRERVDEEQVRRLAALGYVAGGAPPAAATFDAATDPKRLVGYERMIDDALASYRSGRPREAIARLEDLVGRQPRMTVAYLHLAFIYTDTGRLADAARTLERAIAAGAGNESVRRKLALVLVRTGGADHAWDVLAPDRDSTDPDTLAALGRVAATLGRPGVAQGYFDHALASDPANADVEADIGVLALAQDRLDEARRRLESAVRKNDTLGDAWNALGVVRARQGELPAALDAWSRAVLADPGLADAWFNLALVAMRTGRRDLAQRALDSYAPLVGPRERDAARQAMARLAKSTGG